METRPPRPDARTRVSPPRLAIHPRRGRIAPRPVLAATLAPILALAAAAAGLAIPAGALAANQHFPAGTSPVAGANPPYSAAVLAGNTLYVAGTTDTDPDTGKLAPDAATGAKVVMDKIKHAVEAGGMTMDDLVWVQVFAADLKDYAAFNAAYRTYFKGPMPARAFIGAGSLLGGAHFEVMGVAVKAGK